MGRVGTGKTSVAQQLASELDWPVFSSDQIRKTLAGVPLTERTAAERRHEVYSTRMNEQTYTKLLEQGLCRSSKPRWSCPGCYVFKPSAPRISA
jgi:predicted kinase